VRVVESSHRFPREAMETPSLRYSKPDSPQPPASADPALRRGVGLEGLSNLSNAALLCKHQNGYLKDNLDTNMEAN